MLFNSYTFIFFFLPVTLCVFIFLEKYNWREMALAWLTLTSLFFYGWWNPAYLILILISIVLNYGIGILLGNTQHYRKALLAFGVSANLAALFYFKYADFFLTTISNLTDAIHTPLNIILPLAISFFTFQQIAYLVDAFKGEVKEYNFSHYCLFVTFFPQLIAGPIVHHKEMLPQFFNHIPLKNLAENLAVGSGIFAIGLFKKVVMADGVAVYSTPVFDAAAMGVDITFFEAWIGALAYTLQLYFDFSGYSDMAIGIARLFGIKLPINFYSPYKSLNIIEFWRRWHITLSRFLRDYLYISLGGNRSGQLARYRNLFITMLLGGIWHGAGWTFIIWGALHGFYLMVNHGWHYIQRRLPLPKLPSFVTFTLSHQLTFLMVIIGWVFFRAADIDSANNILAGMFGLHGAYVSDEMPWLGVVTGHFMDIQQVDKTVLERFIDPGHAINWITPFLIIVWFAPSTSEIFRNYQPVINSDSVLEAANNRIIWSPSYKASIIISVLFIAAVLNLSTLSEFLYFQF
ncbi:MAG: MBOAT family protein [Porticoccaceae bacterium]